MIRKILIFAISAFSLAVVMFPPGTASADTPGCVSESEYVQVRNGMTKARVHAIFDTVGTFADGGAGGYARRYQRCNSETGTVIAEFAAPQTGAHRLARKEWRSPTPGDVRVLLGSNGGNSFDLVNRPSRQDHVYAMSGRDYVFMQSNGLRDVIRCGPGRDLVHYLDRREARDIYRGCERVMLYSP